jgi:imidazolonepropionase-like amidohydrolase
VGAPLLVHRAGAVTNVKRLLFVLATLLVARSAAADVCVVGGQVVDPDRKVIETRDLALRDGHIVAITAPGACTGAALDAHGLFVIPGLIDLHVHGWGNPSPTEKGEDDVDREGVLRNVLRAGVMATLDLAGDDQERLPLRDRLRNSPEHAALFVASAMFVPPARQGKPVPSDETWRERVRAKIAHKPDFIKIIDAGGPISAIIAEARRNDLRTIVHISSWDHAREAVAAGATAITHFEDEETIPTDLVTAWAARKIWSIPTMAVQCDVHRIATQPSFLSDPLLVAVTTPALRAAYRDQAHWDEKARSWLRWQSEGCEAHDFVTLRRLHAAGVGLLAGSDTGNLGTFQGFSVHREIELMAEAGVPGWDALRAATTGAAAFLKIPWGIQVGAPANLVLLKKSPILSLRNTRSIAQVIYRGRPLLATGGPPADKRSNSAMSGAAK